uniref:Uncharacterized protein n=1 Tax=Anguilla anguilla TaxID=7936 RepID=A0A0E9SAE6_ANGAN
MCFSAAASSMILSTVFSVWLCVRG